MVRDDGLFLVWRCLVFSFSFSFFDMVKQIMPIGWVMFPCFLPAAVLFPWKQRGTSIWFSKSGLYDRVYCPSLHHTQPPQSATSCHIRVLLQQQRFSVKIHTKCIVLNLQLILSFHQSCILKSLWEMHASVHVFFYLQGHSRAGEVQDHYDSLLQRSHGEHRTHAEQTSLALCVHFASWLTP